MILGASGRLGRALWESRPQTLEVTALTHAELDVTDIRAVEAVIALARPDVVINAAAWTDVAGAQTSTMEISKMGIEAELYDVAIQRPSLYGLASILLAVAAGWSANAMFRRP